MNIKQRVRAYLNESMNNQVWYHGTPDVRALEKDGGFTHQTMSVDYVKNIDEYNKVMDKLSELKAADDEKGYFALLDTVDNYKDRYTFRKPIFLTDKTQIAKTYADPSRSMDYQGAIEKVLQVSVDSGKNVKIAAHGDRFRFIEINKVRDGFIRAGIQPEQFDKVVSMFSYYQQDKTKIKTDNIAVLAEWFGFDTVDVMGVLDSYNGGSIQSIVRMVFDHGNVKIVK